MAYSRRFWVKEPRHSETISDENCYLYHSMSRILSPRTIVMASSTDSPRKPAEASHHALHAGVSSTNLSHAGDAYMYTLQDRGCRFNYPSVSELIQQ